MTIPNEALKKCSKCGEMRSEFYVRTNGKPHTECKPCYRARVKARVNGPDKERIRQSNNAGVRRMRSETRDKVFAAYGGYKCVCCGETEPRFLSLDHINNDGAEFRKKELGSRTKAGFYTYRWLLKNGCPPTVQVMCMNCQHGKRMNNGVCPHEERVTTIPQGSTAKWPEAQSPSLEGEDIVCSA